MGDEDTIAAISTPLGEGGIGIVRLSGPEAVEIADGLFRSPRGLKLKEVPSHTIHYGFIVDPESGKSVDEVLVSVMHAPRTYTREDVVEINCHGGIVPLRRVLELVLSRGARMAEPGEFTKRAFLNGRIAIDQAEAILDIIRAKTELGLELALERLEGRFSRPIKELRAKLLDLLAGIEVGIDFPDYEEEALPRERLLTGLREALQKVDHLLEHGRDGKLIREGLTVAIIGRPNVGKSTLLNSLLRENRAIVTPIPGTTRDRLEEWVELDGLPFKLIDTAGVREARDEVERLGVERALEAVEGADLVLLVLDLGEPLTPEDRVIARRLREKRTILVLNKLDLGQSFTAEEAAQALEVEPEAVVEISAARGDGLEELKKRLIELVWEGQLEPREGLFLLNIRERDLLQRTQEVLKRTLADVEARVTLDLLAVDLEEVLEVLGELTGESLT
ncbi:TPA: tRNA uridine-5-carboxymethylaminomethyl(34) synthesis GTPase MnmE, partial [Candidatus Bipolaricaulota bacterium]|nr:tRNA uridine-5-carboxymethylaminomethyl(34) synthesis GTPase MnmE [Candidatus Bipolaricaulota bacterium]